MVLKQSASNLVVLKQSMVKECFLPPANPTIPQSITDQYFYKTENYTCGRQSNIKQLYSLKAQLPPFHFAHYRVVSAHTEARATLWAAGHLPSLGFWSHMLLGYKCPVMFSPPFRTFQPLHPAPSLPANCLLNRGWCSRERKL